jgi:hypothetical protein
MIMGHSESKYQRLEPKKGKVQKKFFRPVVQCPQATSAGIPGPKFGSDTTERQDIITTEAATNCIETLLYTERSTREPGQRYAE